MPYKKRLAALVSKGYFPKELPLVFTTDTFGQNVVEILDDLKKAGVYSVKKNGKPLKRGVYKKNSYTYSIMPAEAEIFSMPKSGYERRNIHITHPIHQALLSYELAAGWKAVQKWLVRQSFASDKIILSEKYDRSIKDINFSLHREKIGYLEATSDWWLKTDISRFYPSIYTHSIAWAAYGKQKVKDNIVLYKGSLADRLDTLVSSCNRNQTIGIPTGPETSRILAEVISSRIDADFKSKIPNMSAVQVDRLQDDWFVGLETLEKSEEVLSVINMIYREYDLHINGSKTSIERAVSASNVSWTFEIRAFLTHRSGLIKGARLQELFSLGLRLQAENKNEKVINYILAVVESAFFSSKAIWAFAADDIAILETFLLKAAVISPISMDRICRIILNVHYYQPQISKERIGKRFTVLAERNLEKGNLFEAIWQIYTLRGLKIRLKSKLILSLTEVTHSSALALILLDMNSKSLIHGKLPVTEWSGLITDESVKTSWIWLLAYEGIRHGWLTDQNNVMSKPFFKAMSTRNVVFYNESKNIAKSTRVVHAKAQTRRKDNLAVKELISELRGIESAQKSSLYG